LGYTEKEQKSRIVAAAVNILEDMHEFDLDINKSLVSCYVRGILTELAMSRSLKGGNLYECRTTFDKEDKS
jgi:hypothetical protein